HTRFSRDWSSDVCSSDLTLHRPKASLAAALRQVREIRRLNGAALTQPIHIIFRPGTYYLQEPVFIRPEDSGTPRSPTIIQTDGRSEERRVGKVARSQCAP